MKLILKRVPVKIEPHILGGIDLAEFMGCVDKQGPFALYTEAGELLPCQVSTAMESKSGDIVRLTVTFFVDGEKVRVEGDKCEPAN